MADFNEKGKGSGNVEKKALGKVQTELKRLEIRNNVEKAKADLASRGGASSRRESVLALQRNKVVQSSKFIHSPCGEEDETATALADKDSVGDTGDAVSIGKVEDQRSEIEESIENKDVDDIGNGRQEETETVEAQEDDATEVAIQEEEDEEKPRASKSSPDSEKMKQEQRRESIQTQK